MNAVPVDLGSRACVESRPCVEWNVPAEAIAREERVAPRGHLRRLRRWAVAGLVSLDIVMIALALVVALVVRTVVLGRAADLAGAVADTSALIGFGWVLAIAAFGGYDPRLVTSGTKMFRLLIRASAAAAGIVGVGVYLFGIDLSRAFFVVFSLVAPVFVVIGRYVVRKVIGQLRRRGRFRVGVIAVGPLPHVDAIAATLHRESWLGYELIGALVPNSDMRRSSRLGIPVLGHENDLMEVVHRESAGILLFTAGATATAEQFRRTAWKLENIDIDVIVAPAISEISSSRVELRPVAGLPLVHMDPPRALESLRGTKRVFDVIATSLGLIVISPLLLLIALCIKLDDGGPVIFRQQRVGRGGELFEFLKFRSMVVDAEAVLADIRDREVQDRGNDVLFKMRDDPRITRIGRFLRRYSLDELPQLWNVLRGDMSLVGPRPALPHEMEAYDEDARRRLTVRPGITGLWQVSGRSDLSWEETVRLDMYYVDNWSFVQDTQILLRTVKAVVASDGAY